MATKKIQNRQTDRRTGGSIYDTVTKTLIELLEGGTIPWRTSWSSQCWSLYEGWACQSPFRVQRPTKVSTS